MKLQCPKDVTTVAWQNKVFTPDERGVIDVPPEAEADLLHHALGLKKVPPPQPKSK